jgi:hypothetical protein
MEKKDLAREYATARLQGRLNGNEVSFSENKVFTEEDIEIAFAAGRESVVENMPELEWKGFANFKHADTPLGRYNIDNFGMWLLRFNGKEIPLSTGSSLDEAKQAANEDYKKRIKQALGL